MFFFFNFVGLVFRTVKMDAEMEHVLNRKNASATSDSQEPRVTSHALVTDIVTAMNRHSMCVCSVIITHR